MATNYVYITIFNNNQILQKYNQRQMYIVTPGNRHSYLDKPSVPIDNGRVCNKEKNTMVYFIVRLS